MFQWDPGDGSDVVEGQDGADRMLFNGSNANENMDASANGGRVRFTRDVANITMDLNDVESIVAKASAAPTTSRSTTSPAPTSATVVADLAASGGGDDAAADNVIVNATNGDDIVTVAGSGAESAGHRAAGGRSRCPARSPAATA